MKLLVTETGMIDLVFDKGLVNDQTLQSAVFISLLSDRRAAGDDLLPTTAVASPLPADRRGWVGDFLGDARLGSRLWLLQREKRSEETRRRAIFYCKEALEWLVTDGHAASVSVEAAWNSRDVERLDLTVTIILLDGITATSSFMFKGGLYAV